MPWLIHSPGRSPQSAAIERPVDQLDLVPTLIGMLGFTSADATFPGTSVFRAPAGRPLYFSCWYEERCVGLVQQGYKFIYHYGDRPAELFDLNRDPDERHSIAAELPDVVERLRQTVLTWKHSVSNTYQDNAAEVMPETVSRSRPDIATPRQLTFGRRVKLLGYRLDRSSVRPGQRVQVALYYQVLRNIGTATMDYRRRSGGRSETIKHQPLAKTHPVSDWRRGEVISDSFELRVPDDWTADKMTLTVEFSDVDGPRWLVEGTNTPHKAATVFQLPVKHP